MAQIPIERKNRSNLLPLILGAILLLLLLGWCYSRRNDGAAPVADSAAGATTGAATGAASAASAGATTGAAAAGASGAGSTAVAEFVQFVAARDTAQETEGNHQYTAQGTRLLAAALDAIAGGNPSIAQQADSMGSSIDRLQRSSDKDVHADDARAAFNAAVSAMEAIDRARGRTRDVGPMRAIAKELKSEQPLLPQLGVVHRFFEAARDALQAMGA